MEFLKILFLFLIAWQLPIVVIKAIRGHAITIFSFLTLAAGITGFIYLMWLV
jgi:hypothetical protein